MATGIHMKKMTRRGLKGCFTLLVFFLCHELHAQLLGTSPDFPVDNSTITIIADASKGNRGLFNYSNTGDVYVHTGVITSLSTSNADWRYVKFNQNFSQPNPALQASYIGNNKYSFTISNIRSYYGVPAGEVIRKIAILFRNGNGSSVLRNSDGSDMYITIYDGSPAGRFLLPPFEPRFTPVPEPVNRNPGDTLLIKYVTNVVADSVRITMNGNTIFAGYNSSAVTASVVLDSGNRQVIARAYWPAAGRADTISFFVPPPVNIAALPAGARDGINYDAGDSSVVLVLFAPGKTRINLIGDFNGWVSSSGYQMNRTPDGQRFWIRLAGLAPGIEYAYQYVVDNSLKIADPYTQKVLDPANDGAISAAIYPNLKPYPTGKTTGIVSTLQTRMPSYNWQVNNFARPDKKSMVIYELLLRDFVGNHDWRTLSDTLSYLKRLGINTIEVMPFNEFEGNLSWGYNPSFYFAPDKYYGPKSGLQAFVDKCHQQGMAVVMDMVLNHSFGQSPMVQLYFNSALNRPDSTSPWFNPVARHAFNVGYDMNHESAATKYFVGRVVEFWLKEYKLDGFRFDLAKGFTQKTTCDANGNNCDVAGWSAYDSSRVKIWKGYYDKIQSKLPGAYVILEHFADSSEEKELGAYGMLLWGNMNYAFNEATMGYMGNSNFEAGLFTRRGMAQPSLITYMESHDEERLMYKNITYGNAASGYSVKDMATALKRNQMAAAFVFMMPGPKMIWQFGELGYDYSINYCADGTINNNCRTDPKPARWDYMQVTDRHALYDEYAALLKLRAHPLFRDNFTSNRVDYNLAGSFKWMKVSTDSSDILVLGNFDVVPVTGTVSFQQGGTWYDYLTGQTVTASGSAQTINLQPGEFHVYLNRNLNSTSTPVTDIMYDGKKFRLKVYPNPMVGDGVIEYDLPESGVMSMRLLSVAGNQVSDAYTAFHVKGTHAASWQEVMGGHKLAAGVYLLQFNFRNVSGVHRIFIK